jgi:large conductance mechanosensitive channel
MKLEYDWLETYDTTWFAGGRTMWKDFKAFVMRGNVMDLAVAVIIGAAFGGVVKSLVDDVIMPPIGLLTRGLDFSNQFILLRAGEKAPPPYTTPAAAHAAGAVTLNYGAFINTVLAFLIVAMAVFMVVRLMNRLYKRPAPPPPDTKPCPFCAMNIPMAAKRCPNCTSDLAVATGGPLPTSPAAASVHGRG